MSEHLLSEHNKDALSTIRKIIPSVYLPIIFFSFLEISLFQIYTQSLRAYKYVGFIILRDRLPVLQHIPTTTFNTVDVGGVRTRARNLLHTPRKTV